MFARKGRVRRLLLLYIGMSGRISVLGLVVHQNRKTSVWERVLEGDRATCHKQRLEQAREMQLSLCSPIIMKRVLPAIVSYTHVYL